MAKDQQFYVGQKVVLKKDNKVLVLNDPIFGGDLPGGKIQIGETDFQEALKREVFEETGLKIELGQPFHTGYFEVPLTFKGRNLKNAGKRIFLIYFTAKYLSGSLQLSDEHNDYIWVDKSNYHRLSKDKLGNTNKSP